MAKVGDLISYVTVFIVVGIMAMIGLYIVSAVFGAVPYTTFTPTGTNCVGANLTVVPYCVSGAYLNNTYTNSTSGVGQIMSWLPIIGIVIAAAVVLGLLLHDLFGRGGKSE